MKKLIAAALIGALSVTALAGCSSQDTANKKVIQKEDKQIVVIDNKKEAQAEDLKYDKLITFDGIRVLDWIDEDTILIMKDNEDMPKIQAEDGMVYPKNFYEFNIRTKNEKLIVASKLNMVSGILSPDKKHIFYKEGVEESLTGYILNRETGKKVKISETDNISFYEGRWVDNNTVIYASFPNSKIYIADVDGNVNEVPVESKGMLNNAAKLGGKIYYTTIDGKLYVQTQGAGGKDSKFLGDKVLWLIPSPDMTKFAMVKRTSETNMTLYITDLEGKELELIEVATQIYGTNWSPDGSSVVYSTMHRDSPSGEVSVASLDKGSKVQLVTSSEYIADPPRWSPSGKQISAGSIKVEETEYKLKTYIMRLK